MLTALEIFWYIVFVAAVACYAMLDGFDLGVGALHLCAKGDTQRRIFLNAIGPVWDGNEVWLVIVIGGMFAGFPYAYATLFSAFYVPLILLIFALIFRAVAIEFRSRRASPIWRKTWDVLFCIASVLIALLVGIALGNLIHGVALDSNFDFVGHWWQLLHPYPLLTGVLTLSLFMMHGAIYLVMKTDGEAQEQLKAWIYPTVVFFIITYAVATMVTLIYQEHMVERFREVPWLFVIVLLNLLAIANIPRELSNNRPGAAFLSSCVNIASLISLYALGIFPNLMRSSIDPVNNSLTISNSAASETTLIVLTVIVAIGLPLVVAYGSYVYHVFRGKVELDHMSY